MFIRELTHFTDAIDINSYIKKGGYEGLKKALKKPPQDIIEEVKDSKLRGRGGAGFSTGQKWSFIGADKPRYVVANGDEGEPGAFKDKHIMSRSPHLLIEGMIIAGYAVEAEKGYVYIRGEYPQVCDMVKKAIKEAHSKKLLGKKIAGSDFSFDIEVKRGAGAYVVGEETALLSSLMGHRGYAWYKPPYPPTEGLWGQPTIINNIETLACLPLIMTKGADWFSSLGTPECPGPKLVCVSGNVENKGVYEVAMGTTIGEVLDKAVVKGYLKAVQIGGISGPILPPQALAYKLDFHSMQQVGASLGAGNVLVLNQGITMISVLESVTYFFREESCGKCFPCRLGTYEIYKLVWSIVKGLGKLEYITLIKRTMETMHAASFCPLGQSLKIPVSGIFDHFGDEIEGYIKRSQYISGGRNNE
jgi:NADH:ubiquinone oxidoreductase subunit F (NADH-binding)